MARYKSVARDKVRERANARKNQVAGGHTIKIPDGMEVEFFKVTKDVHNLDIIGYVISDESHPEGIDVGFLWHSRRYFIHRDIGAEGNSYICPAKTWGKACPICDYARTRKNDGASQEELATLKPKERQLFNVIDRDGDPDKILLWDVSYHLFGRMLDMQLLDEEEDEIQDFYKPDSKFSVRVRSEKKNLGGRDYWECIRVDFKKRKDAYDDDILEDVVPLDDVLVELKYSELENIFVMGTPGGGDDEDEEEAPRKSRRKAASHDDDEEEEAPKNKKRRKPDPEPEEDEEEDEPTPPKRRKKADPEPEEDDQEEEEEQPKKRRGRKPAPVQEEEEDDEEDDTPPVQEEEEHDEEEDTPPVRKKRKPEPEPEDDDEEEPASKKRRGKKEEPEDEEQEDDEPAPKSKRGGKEDSNKCPHGLRFGKDTDSEEVCDSCKKYGLCNARKKGR